MYVNMTKHCLIITLRCKPKTNYADILDIWNVDKLKPIKPTH